MQFGGGNKRWGAIGPGVRFLGSILSLAIIGGGGLFALWWWKNPGRMPWEGSGRVKETAEQDRGRAVYLKFCALCHGPEGRGDGPSAKADDRPGDLTRPWRYTTEPAAVKQLIAAGIPPARMPSFRTIPPADLDAVTTYVLSLAPQGTWGRSTDLAEALENAGWTPEKSPTVAPPLTLLPAGGKPKSLADHRGTVVLLYFWTTWCPPSVKSLPGLARLDQEFAPRGLVILPVCEDAKDAATGQRELRRRIPKLTAWARADRILPEQYDGDAVPRTYLIDRDGRLRGKATGQLDYSEPEFRRVLFLCLEEHERK